MSLEALNKALRSISVAQDAAEETNGLDPRGKWITTKDTHKKIHIDRNGHPDGGNPYSVAAANGTLEKSGDGEEIPSAEVRGGRVVWPKKVGDKVRLPNGNILTRTGRGEGEGNVRVRRPLKEGDLVVRIGKGGGKFKVVKAETDVDAQKDKYELVGSDKKEKIVHAWTGKPISEWRKTDHGKAEDACGCEKVMDSGTHEGAIKAAQTRRAHGFGAGSLMQNGKMTPLYRQFANVAHSLPPKYFAAHQTENGRTFVGEHADELSRIVGRNYEEVDGVPLLHYGEEEMPGLLEKLKEGGYGIADSRKNPEYRNEYNVFGFKGGRFDGVS